MRDKGVAHVAGNCNGKTVRAAPVVTEGTVRCGKRNRMPVEGRKKADDRCVMSGCAAGF